MHFALDGIVIHLQTFYAQFAWHVKYSIYIWFVGDALENRLVIVLVLNGNCQYSSKDSTARDIWIFYRLFVNGNDSQK